MHLKRCIVGGADAHSRESGRGVPTVTTRRHLSLVTDCDAQGPPQASAQPPAASVESLGRDVAIAKIRAALKERSAKRWSVRGGRGTGWGWIKVIAPPARRGEYDEMSDEDCAELGELFGMDRPAHFLSLIHI